MRRGQMEIFGLVFIVLLIMVGLFIYISISRPGPEEIGIEAEYERTQMASNFIDALLKVTTECSGQELWDILAACESPGLAGGSLKCPGGASPCDEAKRVVQLALDNTLGVMQYDYQFSFRVQTDVMWKLPDADLTCGNRVKPGSFSFPSPFTGRTLEVRLEVCS